MSDEPTLFDYDPTDCPGCGEIMTIAETERGLCDQCADVDAAEADLEQHDV